MSYFAYVKERHKQRNELYQKCLKASDEVLHTKRTGVVLFDSDTTLRYYRDFLIEGEHYRNHVDRMNWFEWLRYGDVVRKQAKVLMGRATEVRNYIKTTT